MQVHAESSTFARGLSKAETYAQILEQAKHLFEDQKNWVWYEIGPLVDFTTYVLITSQ